MALNLKPLRVLVIEDAKPMLDLIENVLEGLGVGNVQTTISPMKAQDLVKRENPDIILCDWEMPELDGLEFTKDIRTNTMYPNRMVPIIMISGYGMSERVATARDAGVTEFVVKPFTAKDLTKRIIHVINSPRDFIESENYTGPDRRRKQDPEYKGPLRRQDDKI